MSAPSASTSASTRADGAPSSFVLSRLGSLFAVAPLAVWSFIHVLNNLAAFSANEDHGAAWESAVTTYSSPVTQLVTGIVVLLPLVIHIVWGLGRLWTSRANVARYRYYGNLKYVLQRVSALGVLLFIGAHLWLALLHPRLTSGHPEAFRDIAHEMRWHTPTLVVYLLGTLGVAYHLGNGAQTFSMGWGIVSSKRALKRLEWVAWVVFLAFLGMSWAAIYAIASNAPPQ